MAGVNLPEKATRLCSGTGQRGLGAGDPEFDSVGHHLNTPQIYFGDKRRPEILLLFVTNWDAFSHENEFLRIPSSSSQSSANVFERSTFGFFACKIGSQRSLTLSLNKYVRSC